MNTVITENEARKITGGRKPLVPVEYERACKDLALCQTIDEAKYFSDKADALAAWARIYRNDDALLEARRLKLHAFRRMGILAAEIQPGGILKKEDRKGHKSLKGASPGPHALLVKNGLTGTNASAARRLSKVSNENFAKILNVKKVPSPSLAATCLQDSSEAWKILTLGVASAGCLLRFRSFCRSNPAAALAHELRISEAAKIREMITECVEWFDELEQHLGSKGEVR